MTSEETLIPAIRQCSHDIPVYDKEETEKIVSDLLSLIKYLRERVDAAKLG